MTENDDAYVSDPTPETKTTEVDPATYRLARRSTLGHHHHRRASDRITTVLGLSVALGGQYALDYFAGVSLSAVELLLGVFLALAVVSYAYHRLSALYNWWWAGPNATTKPIALDGGPEDDQ